MYTFCYFKNNFIFFDKAGIQLSDVGVTRGYAVFDYLRTYQLKPFLIDRHIDRFFASAEGLNLDLKKGKGNLRDILYQLIEINEIRKDIGIRMVLTGGPAEDSMTIKDPLLYIVAEELQPYPAENFTSGVKLLLMEYLRPFPEIKTTHYLNILKVWPEVKARNAAEVLYHFNHNVLEASRSNFFIVKNEMIITPSKQILKGCTRGFVLELARQNFAVEERELTLEELDSADEAFITGTTKKITPVVQIEDKKVADGKPGPVTLYLQERFDEYTKALQ